MNQKETYWHDEAPKYHWAHSRLKLIAETIRGDASVTSVLDVGAGSGTLAHLLGRGVRYLGLDITGRKEPVDAWPPIRFCDFDDAESFSSLLDQPFDAVVISGVLEYLQDWRGILRLAATKAVKPNGLFLVSAIYDPFYATFPMKRHPAWINRFVPADIRAALAENNLRLDATYPMWAGGYPWTASLSRALAGRGNSVHPRWMHWLGVNQFLFVCHRN
ncbi:MAG: class I SAM-dependent methyltransferase [Chloroflexi bacterium]|nr:class I SAM-dependent methyltransferase [Chloroflexota bacterium]